MFIILSIWFLKSLLEIEYVRDFLTFYYLSSGESKPWFFRNLKIRLESLVASTINFSM